MSNTAPIILRWRDCEQGRNGSSVKNAGKVTATRQNQLALSCSVTSSKKVFLLPIRRSNLRCHPPPSPVTTALATEGVAATIQPVLDPWVRPLKASSRFVDLDCGPKITLKVTLNEACMLNDPNISDSNWTFRFAPNLEPI